MGAKRKKSRVKVRRRWKISPVTRVVKDKTKYDRNRAKKELKKDLS